MTGLASATAGLYSSGAAAVAACKRRNERVKTQWVSTAATNLPAAHKRHTNSQTTAFVPFIIFHDHLLMVFVFINFQVCLEACNICTWCNDTHARLNCSKTNKLMLHFSVHVDWETAKKPKLPLCVCTLGQQWWWSDNSLMILGCRQTTCGFQKGPFIIHMNGFQSAVI